MDLEANGENGDSEYYILGERERAFTWYRILSLSLAVGSSSIFIIFLFLFFFFSPASRWRSCGPASNLIFHISKVAAQRFLTVGEDSSPSVKAKLSSSSSSPLFEYFHQRNNCTCVRSGADFVLSALQECKYGMIATSHRHSRLVNFLYSLPSRRFMCTSVGSRARNLFRSLTRSTLSPVMAKMRSRLICLFF